MDRPSLIRILGTDKVTAFVHARRFVLVWREEGPTFPYCDEYGGAILNATIGRYAYAHLGFRDDHRICFSAHDVEEDDVVPLAAELPLDKGLLLHRAVYNRVVHDFLGGRIHALSVSSTVDAPPGSGLGASSALVVALVEAYRAAFRLPLGRYDVARLAFEIERVDLGLAGGRQDQYAAAFGGVNFMEFLPGDRVIVNPLRVQPTYLYELEACFGGLLHRPIPRVCNYSDQVKAVTRSDDNALRAMHQLRADAVDMKQALLGGNIQEVADVLNRSWQAKRRTSDLVSSSVIEEVYELGMKNGAVAGKVSGAGGGGFPHVHDRSGATVSIDRGAERKRSGGIFSPFHRWRCRSLGDKPLTSRKDMTAPVRQACILVGGKGTRLGNFTRAIPKPLLE